MHDPKSEKKDQTVLVRSHDISTIVDCKVQDIFMPTKTCGMYVHFIQNVWVDLGRRAMILYGKKQY